MSGSTSTGGGFAGIETGGTKVLWRVEDADGAPLGEGSLPTRTPQEVVDAVGGAVLGALGPGRGLAGVGVAAFGPVAIDPASPSYGRLLATPKPGWSGFDLRGALAARLGAPVVLDTDVNAAALAEQAGGAGRGASTLAYVTVGTGIGGGLAVEGRTLKGVMHPEIGHLRLRRAPGDAHPSACPFHDDCAEGLTAGPALGARLGPGRVLADDPAVRALVAGYLGQLCEAVVLAWSPHRIVLGGGVLSTPGLLADVHGAMVASLAGYGPAAAVAEPGYLVAPGCALSSGLAGALELARRAARVT